MLLEAKVRDTGAHKGILFSTSDFQRGALQYAKARGIATITIQDGKTNYHTHAAGHQGQVPPWVKLSKFIGWFTTASPEGDLRSLIDDDRIDPLEAWFHDREEL